MAPRKTARATSRNSRGSTTPGTTLAGPTPKLKINLSRPPQNAAPPVGLTLQGTRNHQIAGTTDEEESMPIAQPEVLTRRSGRAVKPPRYSDFVYGSDDYNFGSSPQKSVDEDGQAGHQGLRDSSPIILQRQSTKNKPGRPPKRKAAQPTLPTVVEDLSDDTNTPATWRSPYGANQSSLYLSTKDEECVDEIIGSLGNGPKMHVELPTMAPGGRAEVPYTATLLMRVYTRAHNEQRWHICDLVADTWIRAFHAKRRLHEKNDKYDAMCWRPNEPLNARRAEGKKGFDDKAPDWSRVLDEDDPLLKSDVTDFKPELLDQLYTQVDGPCAARNLWADAMALCGSKIENRMQIDKRRGIEWNSKLIYEVMCTALRMTRRKLTLKIEESTEGAWCKRYHMHTLHNKPCYRKVAYDRKVASVDSSDEDEPDEESMNLVMDDDIVMVG